MKKFMFSAMAGLFFLANVGVSASAATFIPPFDGQHKSIAKGEAFYSGGVGITERGQMRDLTRNFNLKLVFDTKKGDYLADVGVKIMDAKGNVLIDTVSQGPWFSARLPAASYRIMTSFNGHSYTRNVALAGKPQTLIMSWAVS